jgi:hypothetical protein
MRDLCRELGFKFVPTWGYLMPVEKLIECLTHGVADCDRPAVDAMAVPPQRAQAICRPYAAGDCDLRKYQTSINVDGTVDVCCASYDDEHGLGVSFLDKEFDELQRLKYSHPFCRQCMATAAHRIATYNHVGKWNRAAAERLQGLPRDRRQATMAEVLVRYARRMLARALRF